VKPEEENTVAKLKDWRAVQQVGNA